MSSLTAALQVADLTALAAVPETERVEGSFRHVLTVAGTSYSYRYQKYYFSASSAIAEALPAVVAPAAGSGRWIAESLPIISDAVPSLAPELASREYTAVLTAPDRIVKWRSPLILPSTPAVTDWIPDFNPIAIATIPTFNADFVGQRVVALDTGIIYKADDTAGNWTAI